MSPMTFVVVLAIVMFLVIVVMVLFCYVFTYKKEKEILIMLLRSTLVQLPLDQLQRISIVKVFGDETNLRQDADEILRDIIKQKLDKKSIKK
ncbi:MAG: hypothetical protein NTZ13_02285 [Candidatus Parcubacteria bacterium]|nr:hypothetical protein [Candidatus Parcubacteria bacterium]